jgi:hypothetical protein
MTFHLQDSATISAEDRSQVTEAILNHLVPGLVRGAVPRDPAVLRRFAGQSPAQRIRVTVAAAPGGKVETLYDILEAPVAGDRKLSPIDFLQRLDNLEAARLLEVGAAP